MDRLRFYQSFGVPLTLGDLTSIGLLPIFLIVRFAPVFLLMKFLIEHFWEHRGAPLGLISIAGTDLLIQISDVPFILIISGPLRSQFPTLDALYVTPLAGILSGLLMALATLVLYVLLTVLVRRRWGAVDS